MVLVVPIDTFHYTKEAKTPIVVVYYILGDMWVKLDHLNSFQRLTFYKRSGVYGISETALSPLWLYGYFDKMFKNKKFPLLTEKVVVE